MKLPRHQMTLKEIDREQARDNAIFGGFIVLCIAFLMLIIIGAAKGHQQQLDALKADNCLLRSESKTGRNIYCGKACFRPEMRKEYACSSGIKVVIE